MEYEICPVCNNAGIHTRFVGKYETVTEYCPRGCGGNESQSTTEAKTKKVEKDISDYLK